MKHMATADNANKQLQYSNNTAYSDSLYTTNANYLTVPRLVKYHHFEPILTNGNRSNASTSYPLITTPHECVDITGH